MSQTQRVYRWEWKICPQYDKSSILVSNAQAVVNYIWASCNLKYAPLVEQLPKQNTKKMACARREFVQMRESVPTWVIIHELVHSMLETSESTEEHNENFVGLYMQLLSKFINIPLHVLMHTAKEAGVKFNICSTPCKSIDRIS